MCMPLVNNATTKFNQKLLNHRELSFITIHTSPGLYTELCKSDFIKYSKYDCHSITNQFVYLIWF